MSWYFYGLQGETLRTVSTEETREAESCRGWGNGLSDVMVYTTMSCVEIRSRILFTSSLFFCRLSVLAHDRFPSGIPHPHLLGDRGASIFFAGAETVETIQIRGREDRVYSIACLPCFCGGAIP